MKVLHVVGARPNYMKTAPIMRALQVRSNSVTQVLVHTGQHYDRSMSDVFFEELELPQPAYFLGVGSGTHAQQTARVMMAFEPVVEFERPDLVLVVGDVNSTLACALVCAKLHIPIGHVEAGLRSHDFCMPEEINRLLTDRVSDLLFCPSPDAVENLMKEGILPDRIFHVGNVMIDTLVRLLPKAQSRWEQLQARIARDTYVLVTLHRPSNVDNAERLSAIIEALSVLSSEIDVIFPVHPRTRERLTASEGILSANLHLIETLGYLDFLALESRARLVITDSGGVQEETTYLGIPCLTLRDNTERPITISHGTNRLVTGDPSNLVAAARTILARSQPMKVTSTPDLWDGNAAIRIADCVAEWHRVSTC